MSRCSRKYQRMVLGRVYMSILLSTQINWRASTISVTVLVQKLTGFGGSLLILLPEMLQGPGPASFSSIAAFLTQLNTWKSWVLNYLIGSMGLVYVYLHEGLFFHGKCRQIYHTTSRWWFQPIWKILVKMGIFPQVGVKIKNPWNHQPVHGWYGLWSWHFQNFWKKSHLHKPDLFKKSKFPPWN